MKAIILAAGEGKRMRPLTLEAPKPMIEVLGKPLLHWIIGSLPEEITELVIVVGYKGDQIKKYFGKKFEGRPVTYVTQEKAMGTGHALHLCKDLIKSGEKFLFMFADDLHSPEAIKKLVRGGLGVLVQEHPEPKRFGVFEVDASNRIVSIEEKPEHPKSKLVSVGVYVFDSHFFEYPMPLSARGEYEYIEPLLAMIKDFPVTVEKTDFWHPIGYPHDIDMAERLLGEQKQVNIAERNDIPVIILAGGRGTRLPEEEKNKPKVLVDIAGKPILQWEIELLHQQGFFNITLALGYKAEMVVDWLKASGHHDIKYEIENEPLGTGGGLKFATRHFRGSFLSFFGDILADFNFRAVLRASNHGKYRVLTGLEIPDVTGMGVLVCDENKHILAYREKEFVGIPGLMNANASYLHTDDFIDTPDKFSMEYDLYPKLCAAKKIVLHQHKGNYWFDCGTPDRLKMVREYFSKSKI
jgi:NDP-sugar pyrophosphorylase family protein